MNDAPPFNPGDVVECVRNAGAPGLVLGDLYNVRGQGRAVFSAGPTVGDLGWAIVLDRDNLPAGQGYRASAFKLVQRRDRSLIPRRMAVTAPGLDAIAERSAWLRFLAGRDPDSFTPSI